MKVSRKKSSLILIAGGYINTAVTLIQGLLLLPLYFKYIGDFYYGLWLATGGVLVWLTLMDMGLGNVFIQRISVAWGKQNVSLASDYLFSGLMLYFLIVFLFLVLGLAVSFSLPYWFGESVHDGVFLPCFQLAVLASGLAIANEGLRSGMYALQAVTISTAMFVFCRCIEVGTILALLLTGYGLWSIPMGFLSGALLNFIFNIIYGVYLSRKLKFYPRINPQLIKEYMHLMPMACLSKLGDVSVRNIEPIILAIMLRPEAAALYAPAKRLVDTVAHIINVIMGGIFPSLSHYAGSDESGARRLMVTLVSGLIFLTMVCFGLFAMLSSDFISLWVGAKYSLNSSIILTLASGVGILVLFRSLNGILMAMGDMEHSFKYMLYEAIARIVLMLILVDKFGMIGLPLSILISCIVFLILTVKRAHTMHGMNIPPLLRYSIAGSFVGVCALVSGGDVFSMGTNSLSGWLKLIEDGLFSSLGLLLVCSPILFYVYMRKRRWIT